ncbi:hypothetical protein [Azospirillum sp. Marseille-Q6669]
MAIADLTDEDVQAWREGRKTMRDLAAAAGVTRQRVGAWLKSRGATQEMPAPSPAPTPAAIAPGLASGLPTAGVGHPNGAPSPAQTADALRGLIVGASGDLLVQLAALARGENARLGASALKAAVTALQGVADVLERVGVVTFGEENDAAEELTVRVMSAEDAERMRQTIEAEASLGFHDDPADDADAPPSPTPAPAEAPTPKPPADTPPDLRQRLGAFAHQQGAVSLRQLALSIDAPAPRALDALAEAVAQRAEADETALVAVLARLQA